MRKTTGLVGAGVLGAAAVGTTGGLVAVTQQTAMATTTFTVDATGDGAVDVTQCTDGVPGGCTLRDAIAAANANAGSDMISFDLGVFDPAGSTTITLTNGVIAIRDALLINGLGPDHLNISGGGTQAIFSIYGFTGAATISGVELEAASGSSGSSVNAYHNGSLTIENSRVSGSVASVNGGAISASQNVTDVTIDEVYFVYCTAGYNGGAVFAGNSGDLTINSSAFHYETANVNGGAVWAENQGDVTIDSTRFDSNTARGFGGGINASNGGDVTISQSTIFGNHSNYGGGGVLLGNTAQPRSLTITSSMFSQNYARGSGSAVYSAQLGANATIANSTFTYNTTRTPGEGGAIWFYSGALKVYESTIAINGDQDSGANSGIVLYANINGTQNSLTISGTIVSGNRTGAAGQSDILVAGAQSNPFTIDVDHSIIGEVTPVVTLNDLGGTLTGITNLGLQGPSMNGGPTATMALSPGSPAIDAGPSTIANFHYNAYDQRGIGYARISGTTSDIGAFEVQVTPPPSSSTTSSTTSSTSSSTSTTSTSTSTSTSTTIAPTSTIDLTLGFGAGASVRNGALTTTVTGSGARVGAPFEVDLHSETIVLGTGAVGAQGTFGGTYPIPSDLPSGRHEVVATSTASNGGPLEAQAWFSVDDSGVITQISYEGPTADPSSALPRTGNDPSSLLVTGIALGAVGSAAAWAARRRQRPAMRYARR